MVKEEVINKVMNIIKEDLVVEFNDEFLSSSMYDGVMDDSDVENLIELVEEEMGITLDNDVVGDALSLYDNQKTAKEIFDFIAESVCTHLGIS